MHEADSKTCCEQMSKTNKRCESETAGFKGHRQSSHVSRTNPYHLLLWSSRVNSDLWSVKDIIRSGAIGGRAQTMDVLKRVSGIVGVLQNIMAANGF